MATGMARGAAARGKRIAFGDMRRIRWDANSEKIFRGNPNIAWPGAEGRSDIEWIPYYKGHRIYNRQVGDRWEWNLDFHAVPGEMYFSDEEKIAGERYGKRFVLIESNIEAYKSCAPNKDWGRRNYQRIADELKNKGYRVAQFAYEKSGPLLHNVETFQTSSFRSAVAILANAALYIGPEGGLHHAAAAVDTPAVVLFGGFIPPSVTGYAPHANLTGGAEACGSLKPCEHCLQAMQRITCDEVLDLALERL
ncbi:MULTISPECIES: glycosyltransferase family 9 protein [unclassified Mesorhizobium]|uniref:glycosyltransferase family 9 protein n=1 Tax=unclassified Mesorhizobium TaxID=325217 RepID=UPI000FDB0B58|nr:MULTISPECIES: glycosyltransferase family 9 protein [unclassified Mesorhizobium]TGT76729.1 lipopolysaccharide heptosyltransferase family protein [Mesorhizobium sp. M2E.F.Ca.ET.166.01.1.1]TGW02841.1 lipopolysaccharide heptosyltransferase family protein [Mesorhizobium sp. M2E.F.Ca.ET.154.01.1.1]